MTPEEVKALFLDFQKDTSAAYNYLNNHFESSEITRSFIIMSIYHLL